MQTKRKKTDFQSLQTSFFQFDPEYRLHVLSKSDYVNRFLYADAYLSMDAHRKLFNVPLKGGRREKGKTFAHWYRIIVIEFIAIYRSIIIFTEHYHAFNKNGLCSVPGGLGESSFSLCLFPFVWFSFLTTIACFSRLPFSTSIHCTHFPFHKFFFFFLSLVRKLFEDEIGFAQQVYLMTKPQRMASILFVAGL